MRTCVLRATMIAGATALSALACSSSSHDASGSSPSRGDGGGLEGSSPDGQGPDAGPGGPGASDGSVYSNGGLSFLATDTAALGMSPSFVAAVDLDGDGHADLAAIGTIATGLVVSVARGRGDGTFETPRLWPVAEPPDGQYPEPSGLVQGDFDGDGHPDLATAYCTAAACAVTVLPGVGDGTFGAAVTTPVSGDMAGLAAGDFDGDGKSDLALPGSDDNVVVLLGHTGSTFATKTSASGSVAPDCTASGDFDGDGKLDLVIGGEEGVVVVSGKGDGTFGAAEMVYASTVAAVAAADLNGDKKADVLFTEGSPSFDVGVALSMGAGSFAPATTDMVAAQAGFSQILATADLNGDGKIDVVVASGTQGFTLLGTGNGTLGTPSPFVVTESDPGSLELADFNGDEKPDLATSANDTSAESALVLMGIGDGNFFEVSCPGAATMGSLATFPQGGKTRVVGFDGRQLIDVVEAQGNGTFSALPTVAVSAGFFSAAMVVADFNADTLADFAFIDGDSSPGLGVVLAQADGTYGPPTYFAVGMTSDPPQLSAIAAGDFDGDGKTDAVLLDSSGPLWLYRGTGSGSFGTPTTMTLAGVTDTQELAGFVATDVNGDKKVDLVIGTDFGTSIAVSLGKGDGTFATAASFATGGNETALTVGDLDGDGKPDIASIDGQGPTSIRILPGNGDGTFGSVMVFALVTENPGSAIAVGDLNHDGKMDLVAASGDGIARILLGKGGWVFDGPYLFTTSGKGYVSALVADFNADGKSDIALGSSEYGTGGVSILWNRTP